MLEKGTVTAKTECSEDSDRSLEWMMAAPGEDSSVRGNRNHGRHAKGMGPRKLRNGMTRSLVIDVEGLDIQ